MLQSHIISLLLVLLTLFPILMYALIKNHSRGVILNLFKSVVGCLLISAMFVIPFLDSYLHEDIRTLASNASTVALEMYEYRISFKQLLTLAPKMTGEAIAFDSDLSNAMPTNIGLGILAFYAVALISKFKYSKYKGFVCLLGLEAIAFVILITVFPYDAKFLLLQPLVNTLAKAQYPWRLIGPLTFIFIIAALALFYNADKSPSTNENPTVKPQASYIQGIKLVYVLVILLCVSEALLMERSFVKCSTTQYGLSDGCNIGGGEYLPKEVNVSEFRTSPNKDISATGDIVVTEYEHTETHVSFSVDATEDSVLTLPLFYYNNYEITYDKDQGECSIGKGTTGQIEVSIPASYSGSISIDYVEPPLWKAATLSSILSTAYLLATSLTVKPAKQLPKAS